MALVLTLTVGQCFYVGANEYVLSSIITEREVMVKVSATGKIRHVTEREAVELEPDVFISVGERGQLTVARITFSAPRSIKIGRDGSLAKGGKATAKR